METNVVSQVLRAVGKEPVASLGHVAHRRTQSRAIYNDQALTHIGMLQSQTRCGVAAVGLSHYVKRFYPENLDELVDMLHDGVLREIVEAFGIVSHPGAQLVWSQNPKLF